MIISKSVERKEYHRSFAREGGSSAESLPESECVKVHPGADRFLWKDVRNPALRELSGGLCPQIEWNRGVYSSLYDFGSYRAFFRSERNEYGIY